MVFNILEIRDKMFEQRGHDGNKGDVFGYDEVRRLTNMKFNVPETEIANPETTSFDKSWNSTYDKVDNIIKIAETENAQTTEITTSITGTHALLNQYTQFDQWGLGYDPNGNTTQKGTQGFTYDYRNQMVRAKEGGATTAEYKYDALGRRIEKIAGSDTVKYYYDGNQVIEERNASDQVLKQYVYGNGIDELLIIVDFDGATQNSYYVHTNAVGSITAITDQNGDIVERVSYDVFGMPTITDYKTDPANPTVVANSVIGNQYLFQGRRYDKETNLYYYRARHYDPIMGRFLQTDPMGYHDSMNMYQAFNMNGVNFVDPMGEDIVLKKGNYNAILVYETDKFDRFLGKKGTFLGRLVYPDQNTDEPFNGELNVFIKDKNGNFMPFWEVVEQDLNTEIVHDAIYFAADGLSDAYIASNMLASGSKAFSTFVKGIFDPLDIKNFGMDNPSVRAKTSDSLPIIGAIRSAKKLDTRSSMHREGNVKNIGLYRKWFEEKNRENRKQWAKNSFSVYKVSKVGLKLRQMMKIGNEQEIEWAKKTISTINNADQKSKKEAIDCLFYLFTYFYQNYEGE
jgi:RHS repeat-associated protein